MSRRQIGPDGGPCGIFTPAYNPGISGFVGVRDGESFHDVARGPRLGG